MVRDDIIMVNTAQDVSPLDLTVSRRASHQRHGTLLVNALMWSSVVVIVDAGGITRRRYRSKDHDPVQALNVPNRVRAPGRDDGILP
ncbi:MAG: hypothetical protein AVDCRST_MAG93-5144 [uncultured Chloroflexia bacterium]|uniref:Uncharacterized protein n=1 Tax=uncultured Chloroflexia bacterium TaxID=1672391 RepID=A0A6J4KNG6_9CHLR|nr:MAG: hypothetical protein AVDCRST_MAG93-5144 [uncultured Chloroflexia bacterium]